MARKKTKKISHSKKVRKSFLSRIFSYRIRNKYAYLYPFIIFVVVFSLSAIVAGRFDNIARENAYIEFEHETTEVEQQILNRADLYINALRSGSALFDASDFVSRDEWRLFAESIGLQRNFPGIQGIGYAEFVTPQQKFSYESRIRSEGYPEFQIRPDGEREVYSSITYLEPFDIRNQQAFGFDMYSEETRRKAMNLARDTGKPQTSGRVTLVQEIDEDVQAGFLIYVPYYKPGLPRVTIDERREAILGYVYSPFRARDFMTGILNPQVIDIDFAVFDEDIISNDTLIYDSQSSGRDFENYQDSTIFSLKKQISVGNHVWTVLYTTTDEFEAKYVDTLASQVLLIAGFILSLLLTFIVFNLNRSREQASEMAFKMTEDLRRKTKEKEEASKELQVVNKELKKQTNMLEKKVNEFEIMNKAMIDRELKMAELKKKLKEKKK